MSAELLAAVHALIEPTKLRLRQDGVPVAWKDIPSVWEQLGQARACQGDGAGGTARFGSRPVISTAVVSLIIEVETLSNAVCVALVGSAREDVPATIRAISANITDAEQIGWFTGKLTRWTQEARSQLHLDPQRPRSVRGVRCPDCGEKTAQIDQDGERVRMAALSITWVGPADASEYHGDDAWLVRAVECRSCKRAWMRGAGGLDVLIEQMLAANLSRETMTEIV